MTGLGSQPLLPGLRLHLNPDSWTLDPGRRFAPALRTGLHRPQALYHAASAERDPSAGLEGAFSAALCLFVLHVLSQEQQRHLLRRLRRCAAQGALLAGSCIGVESQACPWGVTPDGTGQPRRAPHAFGLRSRVVQVGF